MSAEVIPVIDIAALVEMELQSVGEHATRDKSSSSHGADVSAAARSTAARIDAALKTSGFFYVSNHGVSQSLVDRLWGISKKFFALPEDEKMNIDMKLGGRAWRGFFPCGGELTSGVPDHKEGLYFGTDLDPSHPKVVAGVPFHGANQYPKGVPEMAKMVREYMERMTTLGHAIMRGLSVALGLPPSYFKTAMTSDPFTPFRIFNYPAPVRSV